MLWARTKGLSVFKCRSYREAKISFKEIFARQLGALSAREGLKWYISQSHPLLKCLPCLDDYEDCCMNCQSRYDCFIIPS
ncbi:hypothetical protein FKM82_005633 [Ascaphus truei]